MMSKLTLTAPPEIIALAEEQAKLENASISANRHASQKIGPLTKSLTGIVKLPENFDEKEFMNDVFSEKYGLSK